MPSEKRNNFLDADESEDDHVGGYGSEEDLRKGGHGSAKRRKLEQGESSDEDQDLSSINDQESEPEDPGFLSEDDQDVDNSSNSSKAAADEPTSEKPDSTELPGVSKPLTRKNLVATEAAVKKSGVVYLSRIPPYMKVHKLRQLLEPYGTLNRIFLSPEDPLEHSRRVRNGGNKKRSFVDGWVEFTNKKDAKKAVDLLNARTIGGKKGTYYRDDIWCLIYLKGFKWNNLTQQITAEAAERTSRMRAEISRTNKENKEFVRNVDKAKIVEGIQSKAAAKKKREGGNEITQVMSRRTFEQASVAVKKGDKLPEDAQRVASMLFS